MSRNIKYVLLGICAFVIASVGANLVGLVVNAIFPNPNRPDPEGKLEPDPQQKAKAEWLQQLEGGGGTTDGKTSEATETKSEAPQKEEPAEQPAPQPQEQAPVYRAPAPSTGPGNYDAPVPYDPPPPMSSGPGNM